MCSAYNDYIAADNRASWIGGIIVKKNKECECCIITNEDYRERLINIFSKIDNNDVLKYYYTYIVEKERIRGNVVF